MMARNPRIPYICRRCLLVPRSIRESRVSYSSSAASKPEHGAVKGNNESKEDTDEGNDSRLAPGDGAMTRRLQEATEAALLSGGAAGRKAVEDAGFSDELKERLLNKVADAKFKQEFSAAFAQANLTSSAGEGTRHMAAGQVWTGEESTPDAVLRMLDDAKKPLKPELRGQHQLPPVNMRIKKKPVLSPGQRVAGARDRAGVYTELGMKGKEGLSEGEREEMKKEFRERFQAGARALPHSLSGLTAMANERIEDAIARGQFKDLPRGKAAERDPRADNPFIDTTEYLMNKMIQRQEIVPPWIEKQQELVRTADAFRQRLRNDWRRHASRMIAARGGSLAEQMERAEGFARAERVRNPMAGRRQRRGVDQVPVAASVTDDVVMVKLRGQAEVAGEPAKNGGKTAQAAQHEAATDADPDGAGSPMPPLFRDPDWERAEHAYLALSITNLNNMARSYNLMAPNLAKKPYFSLEREMAACYAEVAPQVAGEIKQRAAGGGGDGRGLGAGKTWLYEKDGEGILGHFGGKDGVSVHVEAGEKAYGLKEWWRDFWKSG